MCLCVCVHLYVCVCIHTRSSTVENYTLWVVLTPETLESDSLGSNHTSSTTVLVNFGRLQPQFPYLSDKN